MLSAAALRLAARAAAAPGLARGLATSSRALALSRFDFPAMSPTMTEGGIAKWHVHPGDKFSSGDVLLEIETDKATMDVEAADDGVMAKIIVGDGAKDVQVNSAIAIIGEEGDDLSGADALAAEASNEAPTQPDEPKSPEDAPAAPAPKTEEKKTFEPESEPAPASSAAPSGGRVFASPLARKVALEKGIPLGQLKGTGPNGRIIKADVEGYKPPAAAAAPAAAPAATPAAPAAAKSTPPPPPAAPGQEAAFTDISVSKMRRTIAARLSESKQQLPHYYVSIDVEMDRVMQLRELFNAASAEKARGDKEAIKAAKLSVGDFITKAASVALQQVPEVNSAWYGDVIRQHNVADISIAVATPTGLITPIVHNVGAKGLATISSRTKELAAKARAGKLAPGEYQGGTFTISNMGMFGISHFTAIINPPQSAILAIGGTDTRIVPDVSAEQGWKKVNVMQATLSSDHRVIDGATAARWMKAFKDTLENPLSFML